MGVWVKLKSTSHFWHLTLRYPSLHWFLPLGCFNVRWKECRIACEMFQWQQNSDALAETEGFCLKKKRRNDLFCLSFIAQNSLFSLFSLATQQTQAFSKYNEHCLLLTFLLAVWVTTRPCLRVSDFRLSSIPLSLLLIAGFQFLTCDSQSKLQGSFRRFFAKAGFLMSSRRNSGDDWAVITPDNLLRHRADVQSFTVPTQQH